MTAPDRWTMAKNRFAPVRAAMYDWHESGLRDALARAFAPGSSLHLAHPFEDVGDADGWFHSALRPLAHAVPDVERRDFIVIAGDDPDGSTWLGCAGHYTGNFMRSFLGIPPTGRQMAMRFHEFFRFEEGRFTEMQALWDLPEVMMQAGVWPMGPSLGREWQVPGPATQDGLVAGPRDQARSSGSTDHVVGMLIDMGKHPTEPVDAMRLDHWWHADFSWYGPAGIGTSRGIDAFRHLHQIPFLNAMPDRRGGYTGDAHFFGDGDYVGVTAWPGMAMTMTGDGWLGIVPNGQAITMRSLDFWRVERRAGALEIRENWVLVDLLDVWNQLGVDVLGRMRELTRRGL